MAERNSAGSIPARSTTFMTKRQDRRNRRWQKRKEHSRLRWEKTGHGDSTCPHCGGTMSWCSFCQVWSSNCCIDWGTCQCS